MVYFDIGKSGDSSWLLPGPTPARGRGQDGAERRVSGALAAVRGFYCSRCLAGWGRSEVYPGGDPLKGPM